MLVSQLFGTSVCAFLMFHKILFAGPIVLNNLLVYFVRGHDCVVLGTLFIPPNGLFYVATRPYVLCDFVNHVFACAIFDRCSLGCVRIHFTLPGTVFFRTLWRLGRVNVLSVFKLVRCETCVARSAETILCAPYSSITRK